jgi:cyanophycinase-like exopeptidase
VTGAQAGPLALVGSGEYLPQMASLDASLLEGRAARYVQLATAAVPDGPEVVERWHRLGIEQADRLGVTPVILDVSTREDAERASVAAEVAGAGLIYLSGGNPTFLADTLRDTALWSAIVAAWQSGSALAGCSAGAMAMCSWVPSLRHPRRDGRGLGLLPHLRVLPHFDVMGRRIPQPAMRVLLPAEESVDLFGIDEETALVGGPFDWVVRGRQSVWRITAHDREQLPPGSLVHTPG